MTKEIFQAYLEVLNIKTVSLTKKIIKYIFVIHRNSMYLGYIFNEYDPKIHLIEYNFGLNQISEHEVDINDKHFQADSGEYSYLFHLYLQRLIESWSNDEITSKSLNQGLIALNYKPLENLKWSRNYLTNGIIFYQNAVHGTDEKGDKVREWRILDLEHWKDYFRLVKDETKYISNYDLSFRSSSELISLK